MTNPFDATLAVLGELVEQATPDVPDDAYDEDDL